jgi:hypothetical protein
MVRTDHNRRRVRAATTRPSINDVEPIARNLNALGPRPLGELLIELCGDDANRWARVDRYVGMSPTLLAIFGGDRFAPRPLLPVPEDLHD